MAQEAPGLYYRPKVFPKLNNAMLQVEIQNLVYSGVPYCTQNVYKCVTLDMSVYGFKKHYVYIGDNWLANDDSNIEIHKWDGPAPAHTPLQL